MVDMQILLIISAGIAAYKSLDLLRRLQDHDITTSVILTKSASEFVTPMSVAALGQGRVYQDLFSLTDEQEMGHIQLARNADLILVCPASADIIAKMATGLCDDLATTALLATDCPIMIAPAMNVRMWQHAATQANIRTLKARDIMVIPPETGPMACGEFGPGRLPEITTILAHIEDWRAESQAGGAQKAKQLAKKTAIVTAGPTHEPIDPVRYIANRSSGKQGYAIAQALRDQGAAVTLITGPTNLPDPANIAVRHIETAQEMYQTVLASLPADIAIFAAAVADWRVARDHPHKIKKHPQHSPTLTLQETPDILHAIATHPTLRPALVVGFAAETEDLVRHAQAKLMKKGSDWILANNVGQDPAVFGGETNQITLLKKAHADKITHEAWPVMTKDAIAKRLIPHIITALQI